MTIDAKLYEADGADAHRHGYGLDRNPFTWGRDRGPELADNLARRQAWSRGWLSAVTEGATGTYRTPEGLALTVTALADAERLNGAARDDRTPWIGVRVRFSPVPGFGFLNASDVVWDSRAPACGCGKAA